MATMSETKPTTMSDVKKDLGHVKDDVSALGSDARDLAVSAKDSAVDAVRSGAQCSKETLKDIGEQAQQYHTTVKEQVIKHPTTSILVAVGVGAILGKILSR